MKIPIFELQRFTGLPAELTIDNVLALNWVHTRLCDLWVARAVGENGPDFSTF